MIPTPLGDTFNPSEDRERLGDQYLAVVAYMNDGRWRRLNEIANEVDAPEASVSARLRDMRRDGWTVERRRVPGGNGLHEYRALKNPQTRENGETMTTEKNVAPAMRPVSVTLTAGEWEALMLRSADTRSMGEQEEARHARISLKAQLAKAGVY